jgi:hypothetical protein
LVTPSLVKVNTLSMEPTNGVIRKYKSEFNYFCRLTLVKENHHEVYFNELEKSMSEHFLKRVLHDGVCILSNEKHEWLCHSNSSMKKKSFWFICEEGGVVRKDDVRAGLGEIKEKSKSKVLARQAQNFSSSVFISKLDP